MGAAIDQAAVKAIFARPRADGAFEGETLNYLRDLGTRRPILLLAFAPKAAGTYFRQAAIHAVDGDLFRMVHAQGGRDGTLYLPNFLACYLDDEVPEVVTHVHMQALPANRNFMQAFGIRPTIMMRNIPDMLASFWDMLDRDPVARIEGLNCQVPDNFVDMNRPEKAGFMMDIIAPWYASYFATWKSYVDEAPQEVCVLRYRDFCDKPAEALQKALQHSRFVVTRPICEAALEQVWSKRISYRYNKGEEGRGKRYFAPAHFEQLRRMLSYYPQLKPWMAELMGDDG